MLLLISCKCNVFNRDLIFYRNGNIWLISFAFGLSCVFGTWTSMIEVLLEDKLPQVILMAMQHLFSNINLNITLFSHNLFDVNFLLMKITKCDVIDFIKK